jgi:hypothetical protein
MIQALVDSIQRGSANVTSTEVSGCIKVAGMNPYLAGGLGLALGGTGATLALARSESDQQIEADSKAVLGALLGGAGGYYIGKNTPTDSFADTSGLYSDSGDMTSDDLQYIFGR